MALMDMRGQGPPEDIGVFQFPCSILVYQHIFSGTTYIVAARHGDRGWILVSHGTDAATVLEAAVIALPVSPPSGGWVCVAPGDYTFTTTFDINRSNVQIDGAGESTNQEGPTRFVSGANVDIIHAAGTAVTNIVNVKIRGISFVDPGRGHTGRAIIFSHVSRGYIGYCHFSEIADNCVLLRAVTGCEIWSLRTQSCGHQGNTRADIQTVILDAVYNVNIRIFLCDLGDPYYRGIWFDDTWESTIDTCYIEGVKHAAVWYPTAGLIYISGTNNTNRIWVTNNTLKYGQVAGVTFTGNTINCWILDNNIQCDADKSLTTGINATSLYSHANGNYIENMGDRGINWGGDYGECKSNIISQCGAANWGSGIWFNWGTFTTVSDNICFNNEEAGISINGDAHNTLNDFCGNICFDTRAGGARTQDYGIRFESPNSNRNLLHGNICNNNVNVGIYLTSTNNNNQIIDNILANNGYGVYIEANCVANRVVSNHYYNNASGPINDLGTGTILSTLILPFVDGTTFLSADGAAWGWEIDLATEYAIALGHLPEEVQGVVRVNVRAVSFVAEADAMRLEINGYGGAANEAFSQETIAVANKPSATTNFAANDYVVWTLTSADDADIGHLLGADSVMFKVLHEAAGGADCATDAVFLCVEIQYV